MLREIDRALDRDERISVTEFDVLITLHNAPGHELRMTNLARATMLSSGGMTRLVGRLEERGYVRRDQDPDDARAFRAVLTADGEQKLAAARLTHDGVLSEMIGSRLGADELHGVELALARLVDADRS